MVGFLARRGVGAQDVVGEGAGVSRVVSIRELYPTSERGFEHCYTLFATLVQREHGIDRDAGKAAGCRGCLHSMILFIVSPGLTKLGTRLPAWPGRPDTAFHHGLLGV
jgi:hypothetical protein